MSENQHIEYKQSWHDDYLKWVCGFANASGGVLFVGKKDKGELMHVENYNQLMESLFPISFVTLWGFYVKWFCTSRRKFISSR